MDADLEQKRDRLVLQAMSVARTGGHELGMFKEIDETGTRLVARCGPCGEEVTVLVHEGSVWGKPMYAACEEVCPIHGVACPDGPLLGKKKKQK